MSLQSAQCAPLTVSAEGILKSGLEAQKKVTSLRVTIAKTVVETKFDENDLRKLVKNPKLLKTEIDIAKHLPPPSTRLVQLTYDKNQGKMVLFGLGSNSGYRVAADQSSVKILNTSSEDKKATQEVSVRKSMTLLDPEYTDWMARDWSDWTLSVAKGNIAPQLISYDENSGIAVLQLKGIRKELLQADQKIWVNTHQNYSVIRHEYSERGTGKILSEKALSYASYPNNIWFPNEVMERDFAYDQHGKQYVTHEDHAHADKVELNIALTEAELSFGDIPMGSRVQDNRFSRPIVYIQDSKQWSEKELFSLTDRPGTGPILLPTLVTSIKTTQQKVTRTNYVVFFIGFSLFTAAIFGTRKLRSRAS